MVVFLKLGRQAQLGEDDVGGMRDRHSTALKRHFSSFLFKSHPENKCLIINR